MLVTCHPTFGQLSNFFVGASLEVTRRRRNNKLHFTWGCSILLSKNGKAPRHRIPFFFQWFWHLFKYFNSNHNLPSYSLFSRCFSWFFYFGVHRSAGVFSCFSFFFFFNSPLVRDSRSRLLPFDRKTLKNCACSANPGLLNESKGSWFLLSCLSSYQNGW